MAATKPRSDHGSSSLPATAEWAEPLSFPVVGIGASAGGLEAYKTLLQALPADTGMAFVLVQHLDPSHASMLAEILARTTPMPVLEAQDEPTVKPNHVYVIPPNKTMIMTDGALKLIPRPAMRAPHRPIDVYLRSLAEDRSHPAIGVILSGTGDDGTVGLEAIKAEGGITFAQDTTAEQDGMPRSAIASGSVDFVLPPEQIAAELVRISRHSPGLLVRDGSPLTPGEDSLSTADLETVLRLLHDASGVDFGQYRATTLYRRVTRRMLLQRLEGLPEYVRYLQANPSEVQRLYRDILISVTSFFREPSAYETLKTLVFRHLLQHRRRRGPVRIWVLGCSTGEETYSLAITLAEVAEELGEPVRAQIFATDLNEQSLEKARQGRYGKNISRDVSPERLRRFFNEIDGGYQIGRTIRELCVFAPHNVLRDPPFSHMDLISCRNLLIYLEPDSQRRIVPLLHYALEPQGFLWLGQSETVGTGTNLFDLVDVKHKLYARRPGPTSPQVALPLAAPTWKPSDLERERRSPGAVVSGLDVLREADRLVVARYAPPGVLVDANLDVLHFRGNTGSYLRLAPGKPSVNVLKMAREGLLAGLRTALQKAVKDGTAVRQEGLHVRTNGGLRAVNLEVLPVRGSEGSERCFLVLFEEPGLGTRPVSEAQPAPALPAAVEPEVAAGQIARLMQELAATREYMQSLIEQQEAANEELQSANEEIQSSNEELHSTNEELQASKEEIQSANEELRMVNEELHHRHELLHQSNSDLTNFLANTHLAVLMLGPDLRLRRFTPQAEKLLGLTASDLGRPVGELNLPLDIPWLTATAKEVIDSIQTQEWEVQDKQGRWYSLRLRPYRTLDNRIDGAVMVLVDIDAQKREQEAFRASEERFSGIVRQLAGGIAECDLTGRFLLVNDRFCEMVGRTREDLLQKRMQDITHPDDLAPNRPLFEHTILEGKSFVLEKRYLRPDSSQVWVNLSVSPLRDAEGNPRSGVAIAMDITDRKQAEEALREANRRKDEFLATLAHELRNPLAPLRHSLELLGLTNSDHGVVEQCGEVMDRQVRKLTRLVDDLLDVARISQGKIELRKAVVDLATIIPLAFELVQDQIDAQGHQVSVSLPPYPVCVEGDATRLEQIVTNLLSNAAKYTNPGGRIEVTLEAAASVPSPTAILTMKDTGVGITRELLPRIFNLFTRAETSYARERGGLGIGLSLVQQLVQLHNGTVTVDSAGPGRGSTFVVRLPLVSTAPDQKDRPRQERKQQAVPRPSKCRVLVVDDNADAANTLARLLRLNGHEVTVAHDGAAALETAAQFRPEAIVLDIGLPGMDGYEVARHLRTLPGLERTLLTALSGFGQDEDLRRSQEAGFDAHLVKPVDLDLLQSLLAHAHPATPEVSA